MIVKVASADIALGIPQGQAAVIVSRQEQVLDVGIPAYAAEL